MVVKFLRDYRGKETGEKFYQAGEVLELDNAAALRLIEWHAAEEVKRPLPEKKVKPKK